MGRTGDPRDQEAARESKLADLPETICAWLFVSALIAAEGSSFVDTREPVGCVIPLPRGQGSPVSFLLSAR